MSFVRREVPGVLSGEQAPLVVVHRQPAAEHLRQHVGDLDHAAAVEQHVREQVVCVRGALGRLRASPELGVGLVRRGNGSAGLLEEASILQRDRGVRREGGQQGHLPAGKGRTVRCTASSAPMTLPSTVSGTPRMARICSPSTAVSM